MSPFRSRAQMRAAFAGYLGPTMKAHAEMWAKETPNIKSLPFHVKGRIKSKQTKMKRRKSVSSGMDGNRGLNTPFLKPQYKKSPGEMLRDGLKMKRKRKPKLGSGKRFAELKGQLGRKGAKNPGALAAWIGRRKYGNAKMAQLSAHGRKGKRVPKNDHDTDDIKRKTSLRGKKGTPRLTRRYNGT